jgi:hypothetical protein
VKFREVWLCLAICCIFLVALVAMAVLLAKNCNKEELAYEENAVPVGNETLTDETSSNNIMDIFSKAEEEPTGSPETEEPGVKGAGIALLPSARLRFP